MDDITVDKGALLQILRENREQHRALFEEALEGYRKRAIEDLEQHIERIKAGKVEKVFVELPLPQDHTRDYDRVIRMLEMHLGEQIVLDEHTFQNFVEDDWSWTRQFLMSAGRYSESAAREYRGKFSDE